MNETISRTVGAAVRAGEVEALIQFHFSTAKHRDLGQKSGLIEPGDLKANNCNIFT
jgi:hypothetical protein